jgi:hypothetical protein
MSWLLWFFIEASLKNGFATCDEYITVNLEKLFIIYKLKNKISNINPKRVISDSEDGCLSISKKSNLVIYHNQSLLIKFET